MTNCATVWPKVVLAMLLLGGSVTHTSAASTNSPPQYDQLAQSPASPSVPTPSTGGQSSAAATPQATDTAIGSVAALQGGASVTHNNAVSALKLSDAIFKGDVLQTGSDGTLSVTFDDATTFTLKPNARITIDSFVYQEGGADNAAVFDILRGTVAFVASEVAKTGDMKIDTPTATLGIRGTTGLVEVPSEGTNGEAAIKLYPDADGRVGRIEVFGRNGAQLGILSRGATGFAIRRGPLGGPPRFTAVPLQISAQEAARDRSFVRQTFSAQALGRQMNFQRRNLQRPNQLRPNQQRRNELRPNMQRQQALPGFRRGQQQAPGLRPLQRQPGAPASRKPPPKGNQKNQNR